MAGFFSDVDDTVNDTVGWENIARAVAAYFTGGASEGALGGSGGFEWLPNGEMTTFAPTDSGGGTNFLSSLFGGNKGGSGSFIPDFSGLSTYEDIGIDPDSSVFDSNIGTYDPAEPYYDMNKASSLLDSLLSKQKQQSMPNFGNQMQQQTQQQLGQLNQGGDFGMGMRKGQAVPESVLASLLDPKVALKAYRPTLI